MQNLPNPTQHASAPPLPSHLCRTSAAATPLRRRCSATTACCLLQRNATSHIRHGMRRRWHPVYAHLLLIHDLITVQNESSLRVSWNL